MPPLSLRIHHHKRSTAQAIATETEGRKLKMPIARLRRNEQVPQKQEPWNSRYITDVSPKTSERFA